MRLLHKYTSTAFETAARPKVLDRTTARGIVLDGEDILLIYTKRYNDYGFPGGGVDPGEDIRQGLLRELSEETGAQNVRILGDFGMYEEVKETYYRGYDFAHTTSHFIICSADRELGQAHPESYEVQNGSVPVWVNIHTAIEHNKSVIEAKEDSMGLSIERETAVLELVAKELLSEESTGKSK